MQNCFANWPLILEYLKVLLSWPPLAFFGGFLLVAIFKKQIAKKLGDLVEAKGKDWHARFQDPSQNAGTSPPAPPPADDDHLTRIASNPTTARLEILKWWAAAKSENTFHKLYGTQWRLLEYVAAKGPGGAPLPELDSFYTEHLKLGESVPNFVKSAPDQFLGFLVASNLIVITADDKGGTAAKLTPMGTDFIAYIKATWGPFLALKGL